MWIANVFTVFPEIYPANLGVSNLQKTRGKIWDLNVIDLKKFANKYGRIDDTPYGGGAGMVLCPDVFERAFESLDNSVKKTKKVYLSPRGRAIKQDDFKEISQFGGISLLCGRYEGVDQRILDYYEFEEWSLGDFVLMGGDVAALAIIEGSVRLLPGIVQKEESIENDSFENGLLEHDHYTKPNIFKGIEVPQELKSGDHGKIANFRLQQSMAKTRQNRKDLWNKFISDELSQNEVESTNR